MSGSSLKRPVGRIARWLAFHSGISSQLARRRAGLRILMIHGVGTADCETGAFVEQIEYLARHFRIISLNDAVEAVKKDGSRNDIEVVLTFDDGLRNALTNACPLLNQRRIPATFFVCPGLIDKNAWLWNHESRARLGTLNPTALAALHQTLASAPFFVVPTLAPLPIKPSVELIIAWMKQLPLEKRVEAEQIIGAATPGFQPSHQQRQLYDLMSWDELAQLDPALFTIGAHTLTHPILASLSREQQENEIVASRTRIEARLGRPVRHFCFPNGGFNDVSLRLAHENFDSAVTTIKGIVGADSSRWEMPRIPLAENAPSMAWRMHRPRS